MKKTLVVIGAGGHGKVIADIAFKTGYKNVLFLDDNFGGKECAGCAVAGKTDAFLNYIKHDFFVAVGNAKVREKFINNLKKNHCKIVKLIHPDAVISRRVKIGAGTAVMAGVVINSDADIGEGCIINTSSSVDHDCRISDYVHIAVGAHLAGNVGVGRSTWIGAGTTVINNIQICPNCMIGAGAAVVKNIDEPGTYVGVPSHKIK